MLNFVVRNQISFYEKGLAVIAVYCHLLVIFGYGNITILCTFFTAGLLDRLHGDDAVRARGVLHSCGLHPDDSVGQGQTPQLLKGVQGLSNSTLLPTPLHSLESSSKKLQVSPPISFLNDVKLLNDTTRKCIQTSEKGSLFFFSLNKQMLENAVCLISKICFQRFGQKVTRGWKLQISTVACLTDTVESSQICHLLFQKLNSQSSVFVVF